MHSSSKAAALLFVLGLFYWAWLQVAPFFGEPATVPPVQETAAAARARRMAQDELPQFLQLLDRFQRRPHRAELLMRSYERTSGQYVWVAQLSFSWRGLRGVIASPPTKAQGGHQGEEVTVHTQDIVDWGFSAPGQVTRGYLLTCQELRAGQADVQARQRLAADPGLCTWADERAQQKARGVAAGSQ